MTEAQQMALLRAEVAWLKADRDGWRWRAEEAEGKVALAVMLARRLRAERDAYRSTVGWAASGD